MPSPSRMNVGIPAAVRDAVRQAALGTAARERSAVDASAWIVRAVCEKLVREWAALGLPGAPPKEIRRAARRDLGEGEGAGARAAAAAGSPPEGGR